MPINSEIWIVAPAFSVDRCRRDANVRGMPQPRRATAAIALRLVKTLQRERRQIERNGFVLRKQRGDFTQYAGKLKAVTA